MTIAASFPSQVHAWASKVQDFRIIKTDRHMISQTIPANIAALHKNVTRLTKKQIEVGAVFV